MSKISTVNYLFLFGLVSNLIFPRVSIGSFQLYLSVWLSPFFFTMWLVIILKDKNYVLISKKINYILLILLSMFLSYGYASIFLINIQTRLGPLIDELLRYIPMIPFFLLFNRLNITENEIKKVMLVSFLIIITVCLLQVMGVEKAVSLYANSSHVEIALSGFRVVLTGSDPNVGATIASFFMMYFLSGFFKNRSFLDLFLSFIALAMILLTQGRTTIIGTSIVVVVYTLFLFKVKIIYKIIVSAILFFGVFYLQGLFDLPYLFSGLESLESGSNNSVNIRLSNAEYALDNFFLSPLFGWGGSLEKVGLVKNIDSEVFLILQRYGLFGVAVISFIVLKILKVGYVHRSKRLGVFIILSMTSLLFNMTTGSVFYGMQSSPMIVTFLFIVYFLEDNHEASCS